jgi:hypothetical protein
MTGFDPITWVSTSLRLWDRGSLFLWALTCASLFALLVLGVLAFFVPQFVPLSWLPFLAISTCVLAVFGSFKTYQERTVRTLTFTPDLMQSFWDHAPQPDGRKLTQIALRGHVTNITSQFIYPSVVKLNSPRTKRVVQQIIFTEHPRGNVYGDNALAPGARKGFSVHFFVEGFVGLSGSPLTVIISVGDNLVIGTR